MTLSKLSALIFSLPTSGLLACERKAEVKGWP